MKKIITAVACLFIAATPLFSQGQPDSKSNLFRLNETVPDFNIDTLLNYAAEKTTLSKLREKPLILDFWGSFCVPCIASFPKLEKLQEKFKDRLNIMMVGVDGYDRITNYYEGRKKNNREIKLPTAINYGMKKYFNVREVPHYVWIDTKGVVRAVTSEDNYLNEKTIEDFINGRDLAIPTKKRSVDPPLWKSIEAVALEVDSSALMYRSSFSKHLQGLSSFTQYPGLKWPPRVKLVNMGIANFYRMAYSRPEDETFSVMFGRTIVETKYPDRYSSKNADWDEWKLNNTYCYELRVPEEKRAVILKMMQNDLEHIFGLKARWEDRMIKCFVLTADKKNTSWKSKDTAHVTKISGGGLALKNQPFSKLVEYIQHYRQGRILLDDTGIGKDAKVDVELQAEMINEDALNKALKKYGFQLKEELRKTPMLIISDGTMEGKFTKNVGGY